MGRLAGKVAIVTGGAQGMGEASVRAMAREGAKVIVTDLSAGKGSALSDQLGEDVVFVQHDVTEEAGWAEVVQRAEDEFGPVNILVNNAGIFIGASLFDRTVTDYRKLLEVNLVGPFLGIKAVLPSMMTACSGSIINISSIGGLTGASNASGYCDAKFALRGLSKVAAIELGQYRIRVNTVHPGAIITPMTQDDPHFEHYEEAMLATPLGRLGQASEVANTVLFLASDESTFSTGAEFIVDGGASAQ